MGWPQGLLAFTPPPRPPPSLPPSLLACQPVWQSCPTTPVLRLQKPRLQLLRECQPVRAFPLVGRTHCHTATLSLVAKFLSCFALLSFFLLFPSFSHSASFIALFSAGNTLFVSCPGSLNSLFISLLFLFRLIFMNSAVIFCRFVTDLLQHARTQLDPNPNYRPQYKLLSNRGHNVCSQLEHLSPVDYS